MEKKPKFYLADKGKDGLPTLDCLVALVETLTGKTVSPKDADKTKGGRAGPGTQTEDEVYIG